MCGTSAWKGCEGASPIGANLGARIVAWREGFKGRPLENPLFFFACGGKREKEEKDVFGDTPKPGRQGPAPRGRGLRP